MDGLAEDDLDHGPQRRDQPQQAEPHAHAGDEVDGLDGQAGDAVEGQGQHLAQGVVALPGQPLVALVVDAGGFESHQREHAPQKDVGLSEVGEVVQHQAGHQTVVGVVVDHLRA